MSLDYLINSSAKSWDSYKNTLFKCLDVFKPETIFEYGPGVSTSLMALYPSVKLIDSVEHDIAWFNRAKINQHKNVIVYLEPNLEMYPYTKGRQDIYDMVFVDGREREKCLFEAKKRICHDGVIILHDAERQEYKNAIDSYAYKFYEDEGHTVILTDSVSAVMRLEINA